MEYCYTLKMCWKVCESAGFNFILAWPVGFHLKHLHWPIRLKIKTDHIEQESSWQIREESLNCASTTYLSLGLPYIHSTDNFQFHFSITQGFAFTLITSYLVPTVFINIQMLLTIICEGLTSLRVHKTQKQQFSVSHQFNLYWFSITTGTLITLYQFLQVIGIGSRTRNKHGVEMCLIKSLQWGHAKENIARHSDERSGKKSLANSVVNTEKITWILVI